MDENTFAARKTSFGNVADDYDLGRPGYPREAIEWGIGQAPRKVLDLAAGTGKLTEQLIAAGHEVTAVEPSDGMRAVLERRFPGARTLAGTAEQIPLPDDSVEAVTVAQAFHWFDSARAMPEIARVLRPNGRLLVLWNERDHSAPWVARFDELVHWSANRVSRSGRIEAANSAGLFTRFEDRVFRHDQLITCDQLLAQARSFSFIELLPPADREATLDAIAALWRDELGDPESVPMPLTVTAYRAMLQPVVQGTMDE